MHLQCLTYRAFLPFCMASDIISSSVDTLIEFDRNVVMVKVYKNMIVGIVIHCTSKLCERNHYLLQLINS